TQTNVAVYIKALIAVIPVADLKQTFHGPARYVLQQSGSPYAGNINQHQMILNRKRYQKHHHCPGSVKGKKGQAQESPVHQAPFLNRNICRFKNPPCKAVNIEKKQPLIPSVFIHILSSLFFLSCFSSPPLPLISCFVSLRRLNGALSFRC